jgi:hypothetical protein
MTIKYTNIFPKGLQNWLKFRFWCKLWACKLQTTYSQVLKPVLQSISSSELSPQWIHFSCACHCVPRSRKKPWVPAPRIRRGTSYTSGFQRTRKHYLTLASLHVAEFIKALKRNDVFEELSSLLEFVSQVCDLVLLHSSTQQFRRKLGSMNRRRRHDEPGAGFFNLFQV